MNPLFIVYGVSIGLALTLLLAKMIGFGVKSSGGGFGNGFAWAFRLIVEAVLVAGFVAALIGVALVATANAWSLLAGYAGIRVVALALEAFNSK